ncbi:Rpr2 domain-containing protein [Cephalotus follicularis]|uniref:Rpr2 domain-containing protein n=1 Tax=Cephalotus follicularis TaxID=3775 RepID=A0A1Q3AQD4_CEPFO|nr:Rpr2 domain-containing protein [Cephalotus follicularis]
MGKRGGAKRAASTPSGSHKSISLREITSGKRQSKGDTANFKSKLKHEHLQKLAVWASGEASIPPLAAFFGHRLAAIGESSGIQPDSSLFPCQRCETILQPGFNCTVRIEKNKKKAGHGRKKPHNTVQNYVVVKCHFCSHQNAKRGTRKGHMKEICLPKVKPSSKSELSTSKLQKCSLEKDIGSKDEGFTVDEIASPAIAGDTTVTDSPTTSLVRTGMSLLDAKTRKRKRSCSKKLAETESASAEVDSGNTASTLSKRKRKSWTSLKQLAESSAQSNSRNVTNLAIPFLL